MKTLGAVAALTLLAALLVVAVFGQETNAGPDVTQPETPIDDLMISLGCTESLQFSVSKDRQALLLRYSACDPDEFLIGSIPLEIEKQ